MAEAPAFRVWPPVSIGVPWVAGRLLQQVFGWEADVDLGPALTGWVLIGAFALWNGWCLLLFAGRGTGLLPGQSTTALLASGPYRLSRNPLYVGLLALYAGLALVTASPGALLLLPLAWAGLHWGAVLPEERYLRTRLGAPYDDYARRVRRWL